MAEKRTSKSGAGVWGRIFRRGTWLDLKDEPRLYYTKTPSIYFHIIYDYLWLSMYMYVRMYIYIYIHIHIHVKYHFAKTPTKKVKPLKTMRTEKDVQKLCSSASQAFQDRPW